MRDSIWSAPGYYFEYPDSDTDIERMEEARPQRLLNEAFLKIPGNTWQAKLNNCSSCRCCTRHQTKRPNRLVSLTYDSSDMNVTQSIDPMCNCNCRHMARFICRQVNADGTFPECPRSPPSLDEDIA